ncbi:hypothetical protein H072_1360 [Dactylellina haptotyla CBS 200.50]|uniref:Signal recognition particle subunit SRP14 n=1 Tax=Dactylellina haptotyla (strain CBS 200.50) TaxID=1284197 RepID=S8BYV2_DACHA|nr:hypothetical protein H072_1360 [Dactylellina haptotyla CBS 200.50]
MPQEPLSNDEFFGKLSDLLASKKDHGSVFLTQKRLSYDPSNPPPTKTLTRPAKVTKPSAAGGKKRAASSKFTKTAYPPPTEEDLKADLLSLLSPSDPATSTASADGAEPSSLPILIRATNGKSNDLRHEGKRIKFSTVVEAEQLEAFFTKYAETCKQGLTGLKKKVRKSKKSKKTKKK